MRPAERVNFVLHLRGKGSAGPLEVAYRVGDEFTQTWTSNIRYVVRGEC